MLDVRVYIVYKAISSLLPDNWGKGTMWSKGFWSLLSVQLLGEGCTYVRSGSSGGRLAGELCYLLLMWLELL